MQKTKKALIASGLALVVCLAMLIGTTFAWFTDSVTNKGNHIQAGTLDITATVADAKPGDTYNINGKEFDFGEAQDIEETKAPIISESNWEPGQSNAKLLTVTNKGSLAAKVKLDFEVTDGGLMNALWFDFVQVTAEGGQSGQFTQRPMNTLEQFAEAPEFSLASGDSVSFILIYGMYEEAGNVYQGKDFTADVTILAKQDTVESDGFHNTNYDAEAEYDILEVSGAEEFKQALANGKSVSLTQDIQLDETVEFTNAALLKLNGNTLTVENGTGSVKAAQGSELTVYGNGTVEGALYADKNATLIINGGESFSVYSNHSMGWAVYGATGSTVEINGGRYTSPQEGTTGVIHARGNSLAMKDAVVQVGAASVMNSYGIFSNSKENVLENVTVYANYSRAAYFNNSTGNVVIRGGSFTTDKQAEGWNPNPTIQYSGQLNISDAVITHIGNGILYYKTWPKPTEVENLTCERCTFNAVNNTSYDQISHNGAGN